MDTQARVAEKVTFRVTPPDFDVSTATQEELARYGIPARPDPASDPVALAHWSQRFAKGFRLVEPQLGEDIHRKPKPVSIISRAAATTDNWSGAVITPPPTTPPTTFSQVYAEWTIVPISPAGPGSYYMASWIGIDGWSENDVLQAGVGEHIVLGVPVYILWYEWYPAGPVGILNLPVFPGDRIFATLTATSTTSAHLLIGTNKTGVSIDFNAPKGTTLQGDCAEWIVERPQDNLPDFDTVQFDAIYVRDRHGTYYWLDSPGTNVTWVSMVIGGQTVCGASELDRADLRVFHIPAVTNKVTLGETSPMNPNLASFNGVLYLAWTGAGSNHLNVMPSTDKGATFSNKYVSKETSPAGPALCAHNGNLYIAWRGSGNNDYLNVARVDLQSGSPVGFSNKLVLRETTPISPALASLNGILYLAWTGDVYNRLNVMSSKDNGATFGNKYVSTETSPKSPALCAHSGNLYISWRGGGNNDNLNVARVDLQNGNPTGLSNKVVLGDRSPLSPALASAGSLLYLGWKGDPNDFLNVMSSADNGATFAKKFTGETSPASPALSPINGDLKLAWIGSGNNQLNVALFDAR